MGMISGDFARNLYRKTNRTIGLKSIVRRLLGRQMAELDGCKFELFPGINQSDMEIWLNGRHAEPASLDQIRSLLHTSSPATYYDIGGNSGTFTAPLALGMAKGSDIIAFEPNPIMADQLRRNLAVNKLSHRVKLAEVALGRKKGAGTLNMPSGNMGQGSFRDIEIKRRSFDGDILPLAGFLPEAVTKRPFVIKIDVEGFEDLTTLQFSQTSQSLGILA